MSEKPEYYTWRILLQVCDLQLHEYNLATNGDKELWKSRILSTLKWINQKASTFEPKEFPSDIKPATAESLAQTARGANWLDAMTASLGVMFLNV